MKETNQADESHLISLLQQGDGTAFKVVYDYYWPIMYSHALRMLQNEEEAKDMIQELFLGFFKSLSQLHQESSIGAYLFVSLRNKILNHLRNQRNRMEHLQAWFSEQSKDPQSAENPQTKLQLKELTQMIDAEIERLPPRMKEIFELSRKQYLSHHEIAGRLDLSDKTVKTQINNALKVLRSKFNLFLLLF